MRVKKVTNKLQVCHFAQIPCEPFVVDVADETEAKKIMDILADQHLFLLDKKIIPDYANIVCVCMLDDDEVWVDYWNKDEQMGWDDFDNEFLQNNRS